jgi:hypothetical protein
LPRDSPSPCPRERGLQSAPSRFQRFGLPMSSPDSLLRSWAVRSRLHRTAKRVLREASTAPHVACQPGRSRRTTVPCRSQSQVCGLDPGGSLRYGMSSRHGQTRSREVDWEGRARSRYPGSTQFGCKVWRPSQSSGSENGFLLRVSPIPQNEVACQSQRVLERVRRFLAKRLRLRLNLGKSVVDRPWRRTLLGWRAYFGFGEVPSPLKDLEKWIRRRLRCYAWKQWGRRGYRELKRRGVSTDLAWNTSKSAHGPWRLSQSPALVFAMPARYLRSLGLPSLVNA